MINLFQPSSSQGFLTVSNQPAGFVGKLWSVAKGGEGGRVRAMMKVS